MSKQRPLRQVADLILGGQITSLEEAVKSYGSQLAAESSSNEIIRERLAELELAIEDSGWQRLAGSEDLQFSRAALKTINRTARLYWLKNPLIKRAVNTQTTYVFGQGMTITAADGVKGVVGDFWDDPKNRTELTGHQARMMKETELQLLANIFFVFFVNPTTGKVRIRSIPEVQVESILYNPEDSKEPWYYLRTWAEPKKVGAATAKTKSALYPDYRYNPKGGYPTSVKVGAANVPVMPHSVYHVKVNCLSDMDFGVSEVYAATDWAKAYKEFLEDWATLVKSLSKFAWRAVSRSGKPGLDALKAGMQAEAVVPEGVGRVLATGTDTTISPISKAGATTGVEDGRRLLLMVSAATGIFEHYFGDPSTGNLATASAMERPMELMFRDRQTLWADIIVDILQFVVDQAIDAGVLAGNVSYSDEGEREITTEIDRTIAVTFPDILEKDVAAKVGAIVQATTLGGHAPAGTLDLPLVTEMLLTSLGVSEAGAIVERLFPDKDQAWEDQKSSEGNTQAESDLSPAFRKALRKLDEELTEVLAKDGE